MHSTSSYELRDSSPSGSGEISRDKSPNKNLECYADLFENAPIAYQSLDIKGNILEVNPYWCILFGFESSEVIGRSFESIVTPSFISDFQSCFSRFKEDGAISGMELNLVRKNGEIIIVSLNGMIQRDENGGVIKFHCIMQDLTSQRRAEAESEAVKDMLKTLIEGSDEIVVLHDLEGHYLYLHTPPSLQVYEKELLGRTIRDVLSEEEADKMFANFREVIASRKSMQAESLLEVNGEELCLLNHIYPVMDAAGEVKQIGRICLNITSRKKKDLEIEESKKQLEAVINGLRRTFFLLDREGKIVVANELAKKTIHKVIGKEPKQGDSMIDFVFPVLKDGFEERFQAALAGESVSTERKHKSATGDKRWFRIEYHPIYTGSDEVSYICFEARDITDERKYSEEVLKLDKLESVGGLAAGMAHEFNNVLSGIIGSLALLKEDIDINSEAYRNAEEAEKSADRARRLTEQLIAFSRGGYLVKTVTPIRDVITDALNFSRPNPNILVEADIPDDLWDVDADSSQIIEAFINIFLNAQQAMPMGGSIEIKADNHEITADSNLPLSPGKYVSVCISDFGVGIPEDIISRIFDPFYSTKSTGRGLGLTASYAIVRRHNGHISVRSTPNLGSRFTVYLPSSSGKTSSHLNGMGRKTQSLCRILFVDDESSMRKFARLSLNSLGYDVTTVSDGLEALSLMKNAINSDKGFDLVILDTGRSIPPVDPEIFAEVRKTAPEVPIIITCPDSKESLCQKYYDSSNLSVMPKPYSLHQLGTAVGKVIADRNCAK